MRKIVCYEMEDRIVADEVVKLMPKDWIGISPSPTFWGSG